MSTIESSRLSNGLKVITEQVPHALGVGIAILIDAGPQDEASDQSGLAHLCEHAMFLGTGTRDEHAIAALIDGAGGQMGGFTARDYTCLHATVSGDYVTYAIDGLGDMLTSPTFTAHRLQREIDVIHREIDGHQDQCETWLDDQLKQQMWGDDPLGRSLLGTRRSVAALSVDNVHRFFDQHYTSDRMTVAAAGNVSHDDFVEQVNDSLWKLSGQDRPAPRGEAVARGGFHFEVRDQRLAHLAMMLPTPSYTDESRYAAHILVALLGGGVSSRLYREIRDRLGLAYQVSSELNAYARGGVLSIDAACSPETIVQTATSIVRQLMQLATEDHPIGEEEFWNAKKKVLGQAYLASDSLPTRVSRLATQNHYFGRIIEPDELLRRIDAVQRDEVIDVARKIIGHGIDKMALGVCGPWTIPTDDVECQLRALRDCFAYADCTA